LRKLLASRAAALVVALGLGVPYALILIGPGPLNPSNTEWIFGDAATYYSGWEQYRHDPHLHFPLPWTERVGYPVGTSIALLDAIPLAAVLLRPFSALLSHPFQYLGLWMLLSLVLQAYFGFSLCRRLFASDPLFALVASVMLLVSAPMVYRMCGHIGLTSHWLILAALDAYFREPAGRPIRWLARGWLVVAASAAITPYIAAMCLIIVMGCVARLAIERHCGWRLAGFLAVATVGIAALSGVVLGALTTTDVRAYLASGYGLFSFNLNAPFNPMVPCCTSRPSAESVLLPAFPLAHAYQYEGYSYLGLGTIGLLALHLARRPSSVRWVLQPRVIAVTAVALVCTALAASNSVTFGEHTLFVLPLPRRLLHALGSLRATGRLFWPAYYLIVLAALSLTYWMGKPRSRLVLLGVALAVQLADLAPLHARIRDTCAIRYENLLKSPAWAGLGRYDNMITIPAYQCDPDKPAGGIYNYVYHGKIAAREGMRINNYYAARYTHDELRAHCVDLLRGQVLGDLDSRSVYVVDDSVRAMWAVQGVRSHRCQVADGANVCTPVDPGDTSYVPPSPPAAPPYQLGTVLTFTAPGDTAGPHRVYGWSKAGPDGTWTEGPVALLRLGLGSPAAAGSLDLEVDLSPLITPRHPTLDADVFVTGRQIAHWTYSGEPGAPQHAQIPADLVAGRRDLNIEFRIRNPESPQFLGVGAQGNFFGVRLRALTVRPPALPPP
jgi:hypothetical protein